MNRNYYLSCFRILIALIFFFATTNAKADLHHFQANPGRADQGGRSLLFKVAGAVEVFTDGGLIKDDGHSFRATPPRFFFHKKKCKGGYGASNILLPGPPLNIKDHLPASVVLSGMSSYAQPYCLSSQYCYLFLLTPF